MSGLGPSTARHALRVASLRMTDCGERMLLGKKGWALRLRPAERDFHLDSASLAQGDVLPRGCAAGKAQDDDLKRKGRILANAAFVRATVTATAGGPP